MSSLETTNIHYNIVRALEETENIVDEELRNLENIKNDENELNQIRNRRIEEMKKSHKLKQKYESLGHGKYDIITEEKEFFEIIKKSENVICHFFRPTTTRCEIFDKHLTKLAENHLEARFIKINAEKAPFICSNLNIRVLPTIALVKNSMLTHRIIGFEELGSNDDFTTLQLEELLEKKGSIEISG
ncbi:thioredoxin fold protein related to phosducin [Cryptosporidium ryanae]|uniref:thioredoxin fold protein related to phosducin n=1 Tax=Cryptosporidium ryanae TaxID=515981 RepID=UPI00351A84A7|nr:thioredoxin fold protein related to phosducin [Cryptosporidium ryanae]